MLLLFDYEAEGKSEADTETLSRLLIDFPVATMARDRLGPKLEVQ